MSQEERENPVLVERISPEEYTKFLESGCMQNKEGVRYRGWIPENIVASKLFHNKFMKIRPIPRSPLTVFQIIAAIVIFVVSACLLYNEHVNVSQWASHSYYRPLLELAAVPGHAAPYLLCLLFLPLNHNPNGLFPYIFGSSWEYLMEVHKLLGKIAIFAICLHSVGWICLFFYISDDWGNLTRRFALATNYTGIISFVAFALLRITSIDALRKKYPFELFYILHIVLTALGLGFLTAHLWGRKHIGAAKLWTILAVPAILWLLDIAWRCYATFIAGRFRVTAKYTLRRSHATVLELDSCTPKLYAFRPGQWGYLCIPALSPVQYHPFAILASTLPSPSSESDLEISNSQNIQDSEVSETSKLNTSKTPSYSSSPSSPSSSPSSPSEEDSDRRGLLVNGDDVVDDAIPRRRKVLVLIKTLGDWTHKLEELPFATLSAGTCFFQGPVGHVALEFDKFDSVLIIGGGAALAPALGHTQALYLDRLRARAKGQKKGAQKRPATVNVVLSVQFRDMYVPFANQLKMLMDDESGVFNIVCYESGPNGAIFDRNTYVVPEDDRQMLPFECEIGMPNLNEIISDKKSEGHGSLAVLAIGPDGLIRAVTNVCKKLDVPLYVEPNSW